MHDSGCLGLVHWDDPEGWYGEGRGRRVQDGDHVYLWWIHVDIWQNQYNIVKLKNNLKKFSSSKSLKVDKNSYLFLERKYMKILAVLSSKKQA